MFEWCVCVCVYVCGKYVCVLCLCVCVCVVYVCCVVYHLKIKPSNGSQFHPSIVENGIIRVISLIHQAILL